MVLVHESDPRFGAFDFRAAREKAPPDLQDMLDNHESLPFRRRGYERDGMLQTLIEHAGFKALFESAQASASTKELAKVPTEIQHFDLESFHDRPVQTALVKHLLLPKQDERFTSCVVMYGMGGTGKTVTAVAVVQETAVREHFSHIYWLTVGADAVGGRIRQLQSELHIQLTGKGISSAEVQQKDEQEWLGMLVEAMTMERALVVLDDPWQPEQVRFLNPVDSAQTEHRLLVTTRIRGLAHSRATCIELSMMAKDEAVALLLDVAGISKQAYKIENPTSSQWPPPAAYDLAVECGLLPITLTITAQLVRSWGKGWEKAVLPLLKEEHGPREGRVATTVEERIIGAGLKSLKGEDAPAIKVLFEMFAVTQEDFVHPMAVIELLWRSCCSTSMKAAGGLSARLKVRQWTQVLIDQSLLLGSSSKGVHIHDIVLTYLRGAQSVSELRALQKRVVEGLVAVSVERTAETGRGFQDTGSTAKAFDGEEVDWYVCNVASYHVKQSMEPSLPLVENGDLQRLLLLDDETIVRAVAVAAGMSELSLLLVHYSAAEEWIEAAKVEWALGMVSTVVSDRTQHGKAALALVVKAGSATTEAQQLELHMRGSLAYQMRTGPDKKRNVARMQELMAENKALRIDSMGTYFMTVYPRLFALFGAHPAYWDAGKLASMDTVLEGFRVHAEGVALFTKAAEESVGARKECIRIGYQVVCCVQYMGCRSTDQTTEIHQQLLEVKWGKDGSILVAACMDYRFDRHFIISQGIGGKNDCFLVYDCRLGLGEYCGNVQQMVTLFENQLGGMRKWIKRGVPGTELSMFCVFTAPSLTSLELKALHPFGKELLGLLGSCEGRCTDPSECEEWYGSADWSAYIALYGKGYSSKDGLHHMWLKPTVISAIQAALSLSLASMGKSNFDLSWLDELPAANDPKLLDSMIAVNGFTNVRTMIAEVLEWQGRHKEANRCANSYLPVHQCMCSDAPMPFLQFNRSFAVAELQDRFNFNATSKVRAGRVLGRCHAALGEHALSVSAFDAAIELARRGRFLLSEALTIRGRALVGQEAGGGGLHWDEREGKQRVVEMMGRMQGPREPLERLLL
jgi:hypothetical protein